MSYQTDKHRAEAIKNMVAGYYQVDIVNRKRKREYWFPRFMAMAFIQNTTKLTLKEIGELFNRDHSTVINSLKVISNMVDTEEDTKDEVANVYRLIAQKLN